MASSRWNGKSGIIKPWTSRGQSKRMSFVPNKDKTPKDNCDFNDSDNDDLPENSSRGEIKTFSPEQAYNYKSAYSRYLKALYLRPSKIATTGTKTEYYYHSCNANTEFWVVTVDSASGGTYISQIPFLNIVCPPVEGYQLTTVVSDGTDFIWTQQAGNRTVLISPANVKNPTIFIENTCYTTGCDAGTGLPIILRVALANNPVIYQDLVIYNTPTSDNFGTAVAKGFAVDKACQKVTFIPAPNYLSKGYCNEGEPITITWNPPCDSQYLVRTILQVNTTGTYIDVDQVLPGHDNFFSCNVNQNYRIITEFNIYGKITRTTSDPIYFYYSPTGSQHLAFADDNYNGFSATKLSNSYNKIVLGVQILDTGKDSYVEGFSATKLSNSYNKIVLSVQILDTGADSYAEGFSVTKIQNSYTKIQLGGIVIG